jgi:putative hydrolase of HD superfamily
MMKRILNLFYEWGRLAYRKRTGWERIGVVNPQSIADHVLRTAQIGYVLAKLENYSNPEKIVTMLVFHDIGETRVGDLDMIAKLYLGEKKDKQAIQHAVGDLYPQMVEWWESIANRQGIEANIAKDADILETVITAKEYEEKGYKRAANWHKEEDLVTNSAKELFRLIPTVPTDNWWRTLLKLD